MFEAPMTAANALSLGLQAFVDYHVEAIIEEQLLSVLELIRRHDTSGDL